MNGKYDLLISCGLNADQISRIEKFYNKQNQLSVIAYHCSTYKSFGLTGEQISFLGVRELSSKYFDAFAALIPILQRVNISAQQFIDSWPRYRGVPVAESMSQLFERMKLLMVNHGNRATYRIHAELADKVRDEYLKKSRLLLANSDIFSSTHTYKITQLSTVYIDENEPSTSKKIIH